jgi:hypothetical protein
MVLKYMLYWNTQGYLKLNIKTTLPCIFKDFLASCKETCQLFSNGNANHTKCCSAGIHVCSFLCTSCIGFIQKEHFIMLYKWRLYPKKESPHFVTPCVHVLFNYLKECLFYKLLSVIINLYTHSTGERRTYYL